LGWTSKVPYRWQLIHRPSIGLIRMLIYKGQDLVADSKNIFDSTIKGGRMGAYCFSQENIIWSDLGYKCNSNGSNE